MNIIDLYDKYDNLYFVGGVVRDFLLGKENLDIDITVVGNAIDFCKNLNCGEIVQENPDFGTVKIKFDDKLYDFASTRKEIYPQKGQLPQVVEIGCSLEDDLKRRDFTVNALAKNTKTGEIVDFVNGLEDLKNKKLKVLHDGSFIDDPTRIIRGLKFATRFDFELDENTKSLQDNYLENIDYNMSYKRVKDELVSTFNLNSNKAYKNFIEQNIYKLLTTKDVSWIDYDIENLIDKYKTEMSKVWLVYIALVDTEKLDLTKQEQKIVDDFQKIKDINFEDDFEMFKTFSKCEIEAILLYEIINKNGKALNFLDNLRNVKLDITGEDLKSLGYRPSEEYSTMLDFVLKSKLKNPRMSKKEEINLLTTTFVTNM